ncbi:hypothetical protein VTI74DRAFT_3767 [Chaetomium olivicolor]
MCHRASSRGIAVRKKERHSDIRLSETASPHDPGGDPRAPLGFGWPVPGLGFGGRHVVWSPGEAMLSKVWWPAAWLAGWRVFRFVVKEARRADRPCVGPVLWLVSSCVGNNGSKVVCRGFVAGWEKGSTRHVCCSAWTFSSSSRKGMDRQRVVTLRGHCLFCVRSLLKKQLCGLALDALRDASCREVLGGRNVVQRPALQWGARGVIDGEVWTRQKPRTTPKLAKWSMGWSPQAPGEVLLVYAPRGRRFKPSQTREKQTQEVSVLLPPP